MRKLDKRQKQKRLHQPKTHLSKRVSQKELDELVDRHYGLLVDLAIKFHPRSKHDLEDYIQIGSIGMVKGIRTFDANRGKMKTYLGACIKNEILSYLRSQKPVNKLVLDNEYRSVYVEDEHIWELLPDSMSLQDKEIICLKLDGSTRKEIAEHIGKTENQVRYIIQKFLTKIREANE